MTLVVKAVMARTHGLVQSPTHVAIDLLDIAGLMIIHMAHQ